MVTDAMVEAAREVLPFGLDVRVVRSALEAADAAAWESVETAPTNGTQVMGVDEDGKWFVFQLTREGFVHKMMAVDGVRSTLMVRWRLLPGLPL